MKRARGDRAIALAMSWLAYASYYTGRKGFSVAKVAIARDFALSTSELAAIDTGFLLAYALGQLPSGLWADRQGPARVVSIGLLFSALACALLAAAAGPWQLAALFAVNGLAQATGWPATSKVVAQWTTREERGRVMGLWATCYQAGGIAATALAAWLLARHDWRAVFLMPALWLFAVGVASAFLLRAGPQRERGPENDPPPAERFVPWRTPALFSYGAAYFCIKLIRYALLFWLPFYLQRSEGYDSTRSGYVSIAFEVGGVFGSAGLGWISDRLGGRRALVSMASLLALAGALLWYGQKPSGGVVAHVVALALVGMLLFGPDALLSGAAAQDVGGAHAASAVGLVNAIGSAGALLQGALVASVQARFGWPALFHVFVGLALLACVCLLPSLRSRGAHCRTA